LPHQRALSAVLPYLGDAAFHFDNKLIAHLTDDAGADTLVWLNEYTDGRLGDKVNKFVDVYFDFGRNIYHKQQGLDLADGYFHRFDLSAVVYPEEKKPHLDVTLVADPESNYASVSLNCSSPTLEINCGYTHQPNAAPDLSLLSLNYNAENIINFHLSLGREFLRLNIDTALATGRWSLGSEASYSLLGLMDNYDLASWQADEDKWWVKPLLSLPVLPFVSANLSSQVKLPANFYGSFKASWRPQLENRGHEHSLLENISWDNFLASFSLGREVVKGLSFNIEFLTSLNRLFSSEMSAQLQKVNLLTKINF
jgi:hypothetical protein